MSNNPRLRRDNRIRTIHASLAIENNSLSLDQVTDIINGKRILGAPDEICEVKNAFDIIALFIILLMPYRRISLKDGGTVIYRAIFYSVTDYHSMRIDELVTGIEVKVLGITVYDNTNSETISEDED